MRRCAYGYTHTGAQGSAARDHDWAAPDMWHDWSNAMKDWNNGAMNGFDLNTLATGQPARRIYTRTRTSTPAGRSPTGRWRKPTRWRTACFRRSSARALPRTSISIAGTTNLSPELAEVDGPERSRGGATLRRVRGPRSSTPTRAIETANRAVPMFHAVPNDGRYARRGALSWKYYAPAIGRPARLVAVRAIRDVRYGPDWKDKRDLAADTRAARRQAGNLAERLMGDSGRKSTRIMPGMAADRGRRG